MANSDYKDTGGGGDFAPIAELDLPMGYLDASLRVKNMNSPDSEIMATKLVALVEDEFVSIESTGDGTTMLIKRGIYDTVPAPHPENSEVWFVSLDQRDVGTDANVHAGGDDVAIKVLPWTIGGGTLPVESSGPNDLTMDWRYFRPYPPGKMEARGFPWYEDQLLSADDPNLPLTWNHRDRVLQADKIIGHLDADVGPEPGVTYTARIYSNGLTLLREEVGLTGKTWTYTWQQAVGDFGNVTPPEGQDTKQGFIEFCSSRQNFDSWQNYHVPITVSTEGEFMRVAQLMGFAAQPVEAEEGTPPDESMMVSSLSTLSASEPQSPEDPDAGAVASGMMASQMMMQAGQSTSYYTAMNRNLFESPYGWLQRLGGGNPSAGHVTTVVARPSDRTVDGHTLWTRENWPEGTGATQPYVQKDAPAFTPWITADFALQYLETTVMIRTSSFYDGVPLSSVQPGQIALIGAEFVRIDQVLPDRVIVARGIFDTVPAKHKAGSRLWFVEAASGNDPRDFPWHKQPAGGAAQVKLIPAVYGPPLSPNSVPTDSIRFKQRGDRPYPPGQVVAAGRPWFEGASTIAGQTTVITWAHRNRLAQGANAIDHTMGPQGAEPGQKYRLRIQISLPPPEGSPPGTKPSVVTIRSDVVDGEQFNYTYEMALKDGMRAGRLLGACGTVSVPLTLFAIRDGFESWQGYTIMLRLPSFACSPGQNPGGGQWPNEPGNGNGDVDDGDDQGTPNNPGDDPTVPPGEPVGGDGDPADQPPDPIDNSGGDNGAGPQEPPEPPEEWPDPVEPPPEEVPGELPPEDGHWDTNWERYWDAYPKTDIGE